MSRNIAAAVVDIGHRGLDEDFASPGHGVRTRGAPVPDLREIVYSDFFPLCESVGLVEGGDIAAAFLVSEQTVSNWRKRARERGDDVMPGWVSCSWYAAARLGNDLESVSRERMPGFPVMTIDWFKGWQQRHGISTYHDTGLLFRVSRQAVHNWFCRNRFPTWISRACIGQDLRMEDRLRSGNRSDNTPARAHGV